MEAKERLVYLTTVVGTIQGHLLVGRLEWEGVHAVMRGTPDGPYPFPSEVDVLVAEADYETAQEILLADAVETVFEDLDRPRRPKPTLLSRRRRLRRKAGS